MDLQNRAYRNRSRQVAIATKFPTQATIAAKAPKSRAKGEERVAPSPHARLAVNHAHAEAALAGDVAHHQPDSRYAQGATSIYLLDKNRILAITNVSYPTIWAWMRAGKFPRSRVVGGKSMWLSSEIDAWLANLPVRALKGDAKVNEGPPPHGQKIGAGGRSS
jgi:predicted DNA-binding transcriptional regulator AlpA